MAFAEGAAWSVDGTRLWRFDAQTFEPLTSWQIAESDVDAEQVVVVDGTAWVADGQGTRVIRVDVSG